MPKFTDTITIVTKFQKGDRIDVKGRYALAASDPLLITRNPFYESSYAGEGAWVYEIQGRYGDQQILSCKYIDNTYDHDFPEQTVEHHAVITLTGSKVNSNTSHCEGIAEGIRQACENMLGQAGTKYSVTVNSNWFTAERQGNVRS